jgi:hypothetical protein
MNTFGHRGKFYSIRLLIIFILTAMPATLIFGQHYLFYLHGKIVEDQGANAVDTINGFGAYQYEDILEAFRKANFTVLSEVRQKNTEPSDYAHKIVNQIDSLISEGIQPNNITVVGASKGAVISMFISSYLKNEKVNFVFIAGCNNDILKHFPEIQFCGNILSLYEKTDDIGRSCLNFKQGSNQSIPHYKELELNTGLKHGFLYKPLPEWMKPAISWANKNYE